VNPYYADATVRLFHGDCLDVLRGLPDNSVDAVCTDPPYDLTNRTPDVMGCEDCGRTLGGRDGRPGACPRCGGSLTRQRSRQGKGFMGKAWDGTGIAFRPDVWVECLRVLRPGGHLLAFGGTRTFHRLACAVEDAGFEIRDSIAWLYGSGFPKSLDVSKAIDKAAGATRATTGTAQGARNGNGQNVDYGAWESAKFGIYERRDFPATDAARQWQGWGTALKPAFEPVVVARKPLTGPVAANVTAWGTGALNIDATRIEGGTRPLIISKSEPSTGILGDGLNGSSHGGSTTSGRWPANVVLDESQSDALDQMSGETVSAIRPSTGRLMFGRAVSGSQEGGSIADSTDRGHVDSGGASRFFYTAKADAKERIRLPSISGTSPNSANRRCAGCGRSEITGTRCECPEPNWERETPGHVSHPTVKPLSLMRWLVRLVTPPGGTVLEPFAGSGTTVEACVLEGFHCIAVEREADYLPLIVQRVNRQRDPIAYTATAGEDLGLFGLEELA
jgi:site-specific DNA-methyltransferase (adenine-specific)